MLTPEQLRSARYNLTVLVHWLPDGEEIIRLRSVDAQVSYQKLTDRFHAFFLKGPRNIHQITLADALWWVWQQYPAHRRLCLTNLDTFTLGTRPT